MAGPNLPLDVTGIPVGDPRDHKNSHVKIHRILNRLDLDRITATPVAGHLLRDNGTTIEPVTPDVALGGLIARQKDVPTTEPRAPIWMRVPPITGEDNVYTLGADGRYYGLNSGQAYRPSTPTPVLSIAYEATFEVDTDRWRGSNATVTRTTERTDASGTASLRAEASTVGAFGALSPANPALALSAGTTYQIEVPVSHTAAASRTAAGVVTFYSTTGYIGEAPLWTDTVIPTGTGFVILTGAFTTPANTATVTYKDLDIRIRLTDGAAAGEVLYLGRVVITTTTTTSPDPTAPTPPPPPSSDSQVDLTKDTTLGDGRGYANFLTSPASPPAAVGGTWTTVFADEFPGATLDETKWNIGYHWWRAPGNLIHKSSSKADGCWMPLPLQGGSAVPDAKTVLEVVNSQLLLKTRRQRLTGQPAEHPFTGAVINTVNKVTINAGTTVASYVEARVHVPIARGSFTAPLWTMGNSESWPRCGETDGLETVSNSDATGDWNFTMHWYDANYATAGNQGHMQHHYEINTQAGHPLFDSWHLIGILRTPNRIEIYVDRVFYCGWTRGQNYLTSSPSPMPDVLYHRPQNIYIDMKIGGNWGGQGVPVDQYQPGTLAVDWIKAWVATDHTQVKTR